MGKKLEIDLEDEELLCNLGVAFSSPVRIQILKLLYFNSFNVGEIAKKLQIPASSAALYIRSLEAAGLINTQVKKGSRGAMKICSWRYDLINLRLTADNPDVERASTVSMPVGHYTDCKVFPSCGLASATAPIGYDDDLQSFYLPEHTQAQILWSAAGYVEYKFPFQVTEDKEVKRMILTFEACSEALNFNEDWPSDITVWIDGVECGTWRCPGDFGSRRGRLSPEWWSSGSSQYGKLVRVEISEDGCAINEENVPGITMKDFHFSPEKPVIVRIGNKEDAEFAGGFNLYGAHFGDYEQDIVLSFFY
jgi:predicted transcriptional regulator